MYQFPNYSFTIYRIYELLPDIIFLSKHSMVSDQALINICSCFSSFCYNLAMMTLSLNSNKLLSSMSILLMIFLFTFVNSHPHQISKEHCKHLSYCHYRGICEVRNSTDENNVEYFCQCYEVNIH